MLEMRSKSLALIALIIINLVVGGHYLLDKAVQSLPTYSKSGS
jgi:hypothetical protein